MRKLILISTIVVLIVIPFMASKTTNPRAGLRKTVYGTLCFLIVWILLGPRLFSHFPED